MNKIITPAFPGSYVHLDKPFALGEGPEKYSIQIVLPKEDPFWDRIKKAGDELAKEKWGKKPAGLRLTINDGDATDREEVQGCYYMTASCDGDRPPEIVDAQRQPIIEPNKLYSGAIYIVSLRGYAWDNKYGKGVSFGLSNVMRVADGTPIDGRTSAASDFDDLDLDDFMDEDPVGPDDDLL